MTAEEAKAGLKMVVLLQSCGVTQGNYQDMIQVCKKMYSGEENIIDDAIKLNQLEKSTGMTREEIIAQAENSYKELKKNQQQLQVGKSNLHVINEELVTIEKKRKAASQELAAHMKKVSLDTNKLAQVETLATSLKKAGISDEELEDFIKRQQLLNKAEISIDMFTAILGKVKIATLDDGGKKLLKVLSEYSSLIEAEKTLQLSVESLKEKVAGLDEQAKLKGKTEGEVSKLKAEQAHLEAYVSGLYKQKDELDLIKSRVGDLIGVKNVLSKETSGLQVLKNSLTNDIKTREENVSDLKEVETKRDALQKEIAEMETKKTAEKKRWEVFEGFLGLVQSSSMTELQKSARTLPKILETVNEGTYSPEFLKGTILQEFAGPTFQVLKCASCGLKFYVDKPASPGSGYQCPVGGFGHTVVVDKDAAAILQSALANTRWQRNVILPQITIVKKPQPKAKSTEG